MLNKLIFKYNLYKDFKFNLDKVNADKNALLLTFFKNETMEIMFLLNGYLYYFEKPKEGELTLTEINFNLDLKEVLKIKPLKEIKSIIIKLKYSANVVGRETVVDFLINNLNNYIHYYQLTHEEMFKIYNSILKNKDFFQENSSFFIDNSNTNTWLD